MQGTFKASPRVSARDPTPLQESIGITEEETEESTKTTPSPVLLVTTTKKHPSPAAEPQYTHVHVIGESYKEASEEKHDNEAKDTSALVGYVVVVDGLIDVYAIHDHLLYLCRFGFITESLSPPPPSSSPQPAMEPTSTAKSGDNESQYATALAGHTGAERHITALPTTYLPDTKEGEIQAPAVAETEPMAATAEEVQVQGDVKAYIEEIFLADVKEGQEPTEAVAVAVDMVVTVVEEEGEVEIHAPLPLSPISHESSPTQGSTTPPPPPLPTNESMSSSSSAASPFLFSPPSSSDHRQMPLIDPHHRRSDEPSPTKSTPTTSERPGVVATIPLKKTAPGKGASPVDLLGGGDRRQVEVKPQSEQSQTNHHHHHHHHHDNDDADRQPSGSLPPSPFITMQQQQQQQQPSMDGAGAMSGGETRNKEIQEQKVDNPQKRRKRGPIRGPLHKLAKEIKKVVGQDQW